MQGFAGYRWKCFMANKALKWTWAQAKVQCEGLGGNLARIEDQSVLSHYLVHPSFHHSFSAVYLGPVPQKFPKIFLSFFLD